MSSYEDDALGLLSYAGIAIDDNGDIHDDLGNPAGRKGPDNGPSPARRRIGFSQEDDRTLNDWVAMAKDQGLELKPKIFEDLESINPRHTGLSWQARWRKQIDRAAQLAESRTLIALAPAGMPSIDQEIAASTPQVQPAALPNQEAPQEPSCPVLDNVFPVAGEGGESHQREASGPAIGSPFLRQKCPVPMAAGATIPIWGVSKVPKYPVSLSRKTPGQIKGWAWNTIEGKARFDCQQAQLLSRWGVTPEHESTCVLVPMVWSNMDPSTVIWNFDPGKIIVADDVRLSFSLLDHSTTWVRAATWFATLPHTGVEFDNFIGSGPYCPMEGSHLCHQAHCINPHHSVYEDARVNKDRKRCHTTAQDLRIMGLPIPKYCVKHKEKPCLLQHAALTLLEVYLIQIWVVCRARGWLHTLGSIPSPCDHPFATFETSLPLQFASDVSNLNPAHLTSDISMITAPRPVFFCKHCSTANTFKSLPGYWAHIRDGHPLVPDRERMDEMICAGRQWQDYKQHARAQGGEVDGEDTTWKQAEQMKQSDFSWNVILGWKLAYSRKRKYGKDHGFRDESSNS